MIPADGAPVPPGLAPHLLQPGAGDVPVVAHVVVVPQHRGRDGREQPADQRVAPGLLVEPGVLLVVGDLLAGRRLGAAPLADPFAGPRRALVDVDLVAEQEQQLRPLVVLAADHLRGEHPQRVVLLAVFVLGPCSARRAPRAGARRGRSRSRRRSACSRPSVRIALGGSSEPGGGQRRSPSSRTSYSLKLPPARDPRSGPARSGALRP